MAMTKCKECKGDVSDKAKKCPHCGVDNPGTTAVHVIGGFILIGALAFSFVKCFGVSHPKATNPEAVSADCHEIGEKYGRCVGDAFNGGKCRPNDDIVIPENCRGKKETQAGIAKGTASVLTK